MVEDLIKRLKEQAAYIQSISAPRYKDKAAEMYAQAADALEQQAARLTALESERDALLAAAGKEAVVYVRGTDLEDLKDKRIAGKGCFLNKEPRDGFVALYTAPTAALENGDGRDAETLRALYDLLMCRDVEMGEAYLTLRVVGVPPEGDEFVDALSTALSQKAGEQQ